MPNDSRHQMTLFMTSILGVLTLLLGSTVVEASHQQWVKISITNDVDKAQELFVGLSEFNLKWGHFYDCKDEQRRKI